MSEISDESRKKLQSIDWQAFAEERDLSREEFEHAIVVAAASVFEVNMMMQSLKEGKEVSSMVVQLGGINILATKQDISSIIEKAQNSQNSSSNDDPFGGAFDNEDDVFHA